jgi:hypothetical protein
MTLVISFETTSLVKKEMRIHIVAIQIQSCLITVFVSYFANANNVSKNGTSDWKKLN